MEDLSDGISDMHVSAVVSEVNMIGSNLKKWWVDTGAPQHICSDKSMFTSYNEVKNGEKLYMGNSATSIVEGKRHGGAKDDFRKITHSQQCVICSRHSQESSLWTFVEQEWV